MKKGYVKMESVVVDTDALTLAKRLRDDLAAEKVEMFSAPGKKWRVVGYFFADILMVTEENVEEAS